MKIAWKIARNPMALLERINRTSMGVVASYICWWAYTLVYLAIYLVVVPPMFLAWLAIEVVRRLTRKKWKNPIWWKRYR